MKRFVITLMVFFLLIATPLNTLAQELALNYDGKIHKYSGKIYSISVNGDTVKSDMPPVIINDRSLVPVRAIFEKLGAAVSWNPTTKKVGVSLNNTNIELKINSDSALINKKAVKLDVPAKIINDRTMVPIRFVGEQLNMKVGWFPDKSLITIDNTSDKTPDVSRGDFDRTDQDTNIPEPNNQGQSAGNTGNPSSVHKIVYSKSSISGNLHYQNTGDRVCLIIDNAKLTKGGETLSKFYTESYDSSATKYTITFNSSLTDLKDESICINDNLIDSIEVTTNSQDTSITFNAKDIFIYNVFTRPDVNNTAITILKPALKSDKLVVIDPGHGGVETGAMYGSLLEKDLNLDISLRLNALLKSKNVNTYMIRENDSFVALYERAYIANNLNAALFLSIHNNAYYTSSKGTETLYYTPNPNSSGLTGKRFAQIIQNGLVNDLGTYDRGIVSRPNLVVLKGTVMASALAEIAFMTNIGDRAKLQSDEFRQKAAESMSNSIVKALAELR